MIYDPLESKSPPVEWRQLRAGGKADIFHVVEIAFGVCDDACAVLVKYLRKIIFRIAEAQAGNKKVFKRMT